MARGINKVILIGNLGADPEIRYTQNQQAVANLNIATTDQWRDRQSGEPQERTEWHRVVAFARLAEVCGQYLRKGSKIYLEGRLQTRKWQDQSGQDRYTTEIVANELQMLDGRAQGQQSSGYGNQPAPAPQQGNGYPNQPAPAPQQGNGYPSQPAPAPQQGNGYPNQPAPAPQQGNSYPSQPAAAAAPAPGMDPNLPPADDFDDDIPF